MEAIQTETAKALEAPASKTGNGAKRRLEKPAKVPTKRPQAPSRTGTASKPTANGAAGANGGGDGNGQAGRTRISIEIETFCATIEKAFAHVPREDKLFTIKDSKGSPVIVTAPAHWSDNAVQIIATKYMRRAQVPAVTTVPPTLSAEEAHIRDAFQRRVPAMGTTFGRETNAAQVFHRLAGAWTYWACRSTSPGRPPLLDGDAAARFYDAVVTCLRAQVFAPNSPQWFNTGLYWAYGITGSENGGHFHIEPTTGDIVSSTSSYEYPQAHACFINSLEDNLTGKNGLMDLWLREARIFKEGSGSGANYSKLRGLNEKLSGGGVSSGMLSFLKVGDQNAGSIKSGGVTRRAARMVIVDVDHPDIETFIGWKSVEERKVAALVAGSRMNERHGRAIKEAYDSKGDVGKAVARAKADGVVEGLISKILQRCKEGLALPSEIYTTDWQDESYATVSGQNANNSVRATDRFMKAVEANGTFDLIRRTDGSVAKTLPARELWHQINESSWDCADPGLQFHDTINLWNTAANTGAIVGSNPCSEYMFLDNTGCNLASTRLTAYLRPDGTFDLDAYAAVCGVITMILDVTVSMGQYPSREIAEGTRDFRTLGLGFADIGGLLMRLGIPYDSDRGRALAAALSSIMTGEGYRVSSIMAHSQGPFPGYLRNKVPTDNVIHKHAGAHHALTRDAAAVQAADWDQVRPHQKRVDEIIATALQIGNTAWQRAHAGREDGYRNAQISCVAPTGTIGLAMDCDTTGIEPDFSIVKFKSLAGGGWMTITNRCADRALHSLGYEEADIEAIEAYIAENSTTDGCDLVREEDRAVFDCATAGGAKGVRFIEPKGHVEMMAWVQPFISGAISKTVNMPATTTVQEVGDIHMLAWKRGLKSVAIYRDRCKLSQPLSSEILKDLGIDGEVVLEAVAADDAPKAIAALGNIARKMPSRRFGYTQKADIGDHRLYLTANTFDDGKTVGEIFIATSKEGAAFRSLMSAFAVAVSMGLQRGVPLSDYVDAFVFTRFEPAGFVKHHDKLKNATSILDFVFRDLAISFLGRDDLAHVKDEAAPVSGSTDVGHGISEGTKAAVASIPAIAAAIEAKPTVATEKGARELGYTGSTCTNCQSNRMKRSGTCEICEDCFSTSGGCS